MAQVAAKVEAPKVEKPAEQKPREIDPRQMKLNVEGFEWREWMATMPEGMVADDLRDPTVWRRVQGRVQTSLRKYDQLRIFSFDESQEIEATVAHADGTKAVLTIRSVKSFRDKDQGLFSDGTLSVFWDGGAYGVRRVSDGVRVINEGFTTEELAVAGLRGYYPKRVA